jgi:hypothetical protein
MADDRYVFNILPIEILMFLDYLSMKDISNLDIAICDVDLRLSFLNSFQIRDDTTKTQGDNFVTWIIKRQLKLLNFIAYLKTFTIVSADKMAAGMISLDAMEELHLHAKRKCWFIIPLPIVS